MLKNKIIILPLEGSWNHSADFLRQTAFTLSKNNLVYIYDQNNHYFFLKKNKKKSYPHHQNIIFHQVKYYLPFERFKLIDKINRHLSFKIFTKTLPKKKKILWIFYPYYYDLAKIAAKSICKIYDCVDYNENQKQEEALIDNVDYFFVNSLALKNLHKNKSKKPIYLNAQGFFQPEDKKMVKFTLNKGNKKAIIGYVGGINYRLDYPLLYKLIVNHPEFLFVFYGPEQRNPRLDKIYQTQKWIKKIKQYENTLFGQSSDHNFIYGLIKNFDLAIIPYNLKLRFNSYCYPMKLFEYFYFKKSVVSSAILELKSKKFNKYIRIADNYKDWENAIEELLSNKNSKKIKNEERKIALQNSWPNKINKISKFID